MQIVESFSALKQKKLKKTVMTIGMFDGLHRGHQKVIRSVVKEAEKRNSPSLVVTFKTHPSKTLFKDKQRHVSLITPIEEKLSLLKKMGIQCVLLLPFNRKISQITAESFLKNMLFDSAEIDLICIGEDTTFGKGGLGDVGFLMKMKIILGYQLKVIPNVKSGAVIIRSTRIREYLRNGELVKANKLLGRPFCLTGKVIRGDRLGNRIGFPTANIQTDQEIIPKNGVYAVWAQIKGKLYRGVLNIGVRPTLKRKSKKIHIEVHLLNFHQQIYGQNLKLFFIRHLRDERAFSGLDPLQKQIKIDRDRARAFLSSSISVS